MLLLADDSLQRQPNIRSDRKCLNDLQPQGQLEQDLQKTMCDFTSSLSTPSRHPRND